MCGRKFAISRIHSLMDPTTGTEPIGTEIVPTSCGAHFWVPHEWSEPFISFKIILRVALQKGLNSKWTMENIRSTTDAYPIELTTYTYPLEVSYKSNSIIIRNILIEVIIWRLPSTWRERKQNHSVQVFLRLLECFFTTWLLKFRANLIWLLP